MAWLAVISEVNVTAEGIWAYRETGGQRDRRERYGGSLFEEGVKGQERHALSPSLPGRRRKAGSCQYSRRTDGTSRLTIGGDTAARPSTTFRDRKSCTIAMNPTQGEVPALVNTPNFDNNILFWACCGKNGLTALQRGQSEIHAQPFPASDSPRFLL